MVIRNNSDLKMWSVCTIIIIFFYIDIVESGWFLLKIMNKNYFFYKLESTKNLAARFIRPLGLLNP